MLLIGTTSIAVADWEPSDGHKMHFPQMPDPTGWDVNFHDYFLADDWRCSKTGPVNDIHFWISWRHDIIEDLPYITTYIYSNDPDGTYSKPLEQLWTRTFTLDQFIVAGPWIGDQGWMEPYGEFFEHDHQFYYQINIKNITQPFIQQNNTIYWLIIQMPFLYPIEMGWKTSQDHFMDAAVWGSPGQWTPIIDPLEQTPIDFAFVITGEDEEPIPDLDCNGTLSWDSIKPGSSVTGTFQVGNIGQPGSLLKWQITGKPSWGTWTFTPSSGTGLAAGSWTNVAVTCVAPPNKNKLFTGTINITNMDDSTDVCKISVSLKTPLIFDIHFQLFQLFFQKLFEQIPRAFPILRYLMGY